MDAYDAVLCQKERNNSLPLPLKAFEAFENKYGSATGILYNLTERSGKVYYLHCKYSPITWATFKNIVKIILFVEKMGISENIMIKAGKSHVIAFLREVEVRIRDYKGQVISKEVVFKRMKERGFSEREIKYTRLFRNFFKPVDTGV